MRYRNGMLGRPFQMSSKPPPDVMSSAEHAEMSRLAGHLNKRGIPFLFALAPCKMDESMELFPNGWTGWNYNRRARELLAFLEEHGVRLLDFSPRFAATVDDVTKSFFRTDHHWTIRSAFAATRSIVDELSVMLKNPSLADAVELSESNWEWRFVDGGFIGSHGRRTGILFSGLDDFEYAVPKFETDIEIEVRYDKRGLDGIVRGDFEHTEIRRKYLRESYAENRYNLYVGTRKAVGIHRNNRARINSRLMLIKDSFGKPVACFLATLFCEIVEVDPRYLPKDVTLESLVDEYRPDVVVRVSNPSTLHYTKNKKEELH
jgi:hypothetical protein